MVVLVRLRLTLLQSVAACNGGSVVFNSSAAGTNL
jgi:hypothetical protein